MTGYSADVTEGYTNMRVDKYSRTNSSIIFLSENSSSGHTMLREIDFESLLKPWNDRPFDPTTEKMKQSPKTARIIEYLIIHILFDYDHGIRKKLPSPQYRVIMCSFVRVKQSAKNIIGVLHVVRVHRTIRDSQQGNWSFITIMRFKTFYWFLLRSFTKSFFQ